MSTHDTIFDAVRSVGEEQGKTLPALTDETVLLDTGLDSLCFAILIARLEADLGTDPFSSEDGFDFPVTLGDLVRLYDGASGRSQAA